MIFQELAPYVPLPQRPSIQTTLYDEIGPDPNGYHGLLKGGNHIIFLRDPYAEDVNYALESIDPKLQMVGLNANKFVIAAHESAGHAGFAELYDQAEATDVFEVGRESTSTEKSVRLVNALTEGYAMFIEEIAMDLAYSPTLGQIKNSVDMSIKKLSDRREQHLAKYKEHPRIRIYSDGRTLVRKLFEQLGIEKAPKKDQLIKLREILSGLDLREIAKIKPGDPLYEECILDPLNKLPKKTQPIS